uniref:G-patch domain-containing protein n=1 Tax=Proboscia inermis TaxID=420281 RepID=A0A7S0CLK2_9STRA|mmetsp:Transcript_854/g.896  ORF Transcript_854/g.896 Transcript_854/m.896 type:complete len:260 (+) Transcript_854:151-930(+)
MTIVSTEDTRNAQWAKDKSGFGHKMLSKMGWSEGKGLGKNNQGASKNLRGVRRKEVELGIGAQTSDQMNSTGWSETRANYQSVLSNLKATHGSANSRSPIMKKKKSKKDKRRKLSKKRVGGLTLAQNKVTSGYAAKMRNAKDLSTKSSQDMAAIFGMKIEDVATTSLSVRPPLPLYIVSSSSPPQTEGIIKSSSSWKKAKKNTKKRLRFEVSEDKTEDYSNNVVTSSSDDGFELNDSNRQNEKKKTKKSKKKKKRKVEE